MTSAASTSLAVSRALDTVMREDRGRLISALISRVRDFQLAEEVLQEAMVSALVHWGRNGLPASPQGWLLQVAWRKALDRLRRHKTAVKAGEALKPIADMAYEEEPEEIPDERLRLIFTCCHPALEQKSRIALTLRTICGLSTAEVAAAFLDQETTMGQRLSRAKAKIAAAGIPYAVPQADEWAARLQGVLAVLYLIFNAGYSRPEAARSLTDEKRGLTGEAIFLARLLVRLSPDEAEVEGCLALMLLTEARSAARIGPDGATRPMADQDRALWDKALMDEGLALIERAMHRRRPGPYQIKAAIAACHMMPDGSDWPQIAALYDGLLRFEPTPVVQLNRAVAMAEAGGLEAGLGLLETLAGELASYQPFHAASAALLHRAGRKERAARAYREAIALAASPADALFLTRRLQALTVATEPAACDRSPETSPDLG